MGIPGGNRCRYLAHGPLLQPHARRSPPAYTDQFRGCSLEPRRPARHARHSRRILDRGGVARVPELGLGDAFPFLPDDRHLGGLPFRPPRRNRIRWPRRTRPLVSGGRLLLFPMGLRHRQLASHVEAPSGIRSRRRSGMVLQRLPDSLVATGRSRCSLRSLAPHQRSATKSPQPRSAWILAPDPFWRMGRPCPSDWWTDSCLDGLRWSCGWSALSDADPDRDDQSPQSP